VFLYVFFGFIKWRNSRHRKIWNTNLKTWKEQTVYASLQRFISANCLTLLSTILLLELVADWHLIKFVASIQLRQQPTDLPRPLSPKYSPHRLFPYDSAQYYPSIVSVPTYWRLLLRLIGHSFYEILSPMRIACPIFSSQQFNY
jgi:hypothetical protein